METNEKWLTLNIYHFSFGTYYGVYGVANMNIVERNFPITEKKAADSSIAIPKATHVP